MIIEYASIPGETLCGTSCRSLRRGFLFLSVCVCDSDLSQPQHIDVSGFYCQLQATQYRSQLMTKRMQMGKMDVIVFPAFSHFNLFDKMTDIVTSDDEIIQNNVSLLFCFRSSLINTSTRLSERCW